MATRAVIAEPNDKGWVGVYHHLDGYPDGLGKTLWSIRGPVFDGDIEQMRQVLIRDHPAGWSSIVKADWTQPAGGRDSRDFVCTECEAHMRAHYRQYYRDKTLLPPPGVWNQANNILVLGHDPVKSTAPVGPQCYCHGVSTDDPATITSEGDNCGTVYAYVLRDEALEIQAQDDQGNWALHWSIPWNAKDFDWKALD